MTKEAARALLEDCLSLEGELARTVERVMRLVPKSEQDPHRAHMPWISSWRSTRTWRH